MSNKITLSLSLLLAFAACGTPEASVTPPAPPPVSVPAPEPAPAPPPMTPEERTAATWTLLREHGITASFDEISRSRVVGEAMAAGMPTMASTRDQLSAWPSGPDYSTLARNATRHVGTPIAFTGRIVTIREANDGTTTLYMSTGSYGSRPLYVIVPHPLTRAREGQRVRVYGKVLGAYSYEAINGHHMTVPALLAGTARTANRRRHRY